MKHFTVRRIDGSLIYITNPMFGVLKPIWKPRIKFQEYWLLVQSKPDRPPETYHCTYLVDWVNETARNYDGLFENARLLFDTKRQQWDASMTCEAFISQFRKFLEGGANTKRVTKIICFGLGDLNHKPHDLWRIHNNALPEDKREPETSIIDDALVQHAIALTIADIVRSYTKPGDGGVRLLTQDPDYREETKNILEEIGFEVVGRYGAGGFAEVDNEFVVFSAFPNAPVRQIITDLARPLAITTSPKYTTGGVWNTRGKPFADPESPRTRQMWKGYESLNFPILSDSTQLGGSLHLLEGYTRIGDCGTAD